MALASHVRLAARAVRLKLRLLTAHDTLWPAAVRGGKLLLRGRVGTFTRKLFNEMPDASDVDKAATDRPGPPLFLGGNVLGLGGYDHLVRNVMKGLAESGVNLCRDRRSWFRKQYVPSEIRPAELARRPHHPRLVVAPPHRLRRYHLDSRTAVFTMWETDTLPAGAVELLNRSGLVIVPSRWGANDFRANGVTAPTEVVPLGYDPTTFSRDAEAADRSAPVRGLRVAAKQTVFGTAGALDEGGLRKNVQRVIDLFRVAFPGEPNVRLRVKVTPNSPPVATHGDARIEVLDRPLSPAELADWYRSLTAYVNASFGEGFGLHLLEAMACGVPLISTAFGGPGMFFDPRVGYEVPYALVPARNAVYGGHWADPDDGHLVARMRQVNRNRHEARALGEAAAERAARFRWEDTTRRLVIALIRHGFIRPEPAAPRRAMPGS